MEKKKKKDSNKKHSILRSNQKNPLPKIAGKRSNKNIVTIENLLGDEKHGLQIKITASKEDWEMLYSLFYFHNESFNKYFAKSFIDRIPELFKSRGYINTLIGKTILKSHNSYRVHLLRNIKSNAATLYMFFSYCFRKHKNEMLPVYIQRIIAEASDDEKLQLMKNSGKPDPLGFTGYCLQTFYGDALLRDYNLDPFSDSDNFYITYVQGGKEIIKRHYDWAVVCWHIIFCRSDKKEVVNFLGNMSKAFTTLSGSVQNLNEDSLSIRDMLSKVFAWFKKEIDDILIRSFHGFNSKKDLQLFMKKHNLKSYDDLARFWVDYNRELEKKILAGEASVTVYS